MKRIFIPLVLLLIGCSPKIIETVRTEYVYRDRVQHDTTWTRDSVYIREYIKGDTVRTIEYRDRTVYQYKYLHNTDTVFRHDTTCVEKEKIVEKPLTTSQKMKINSFWALLAVAAALAVWTFRKPLLGLIKLIVK